MPIGTNGHMTESEQTRKKVICVVVMSLVDIKSQSDLETGFPTEKSLIEELMKLKIVESEKICSKCGRGMELRTRKDGYQVICVVVMSLVDIKSQSDLETGFPTEKSLIEELMKLKIVESEKICSKCGRGMELRTRKDGYQWRCRKTSGKECSTKTVKDGSWFSKVAMPLRQALKIMICWKMKMTGRQIESLLKVSHVTIADWRSMLREMCSLMVCNNPPLGGLGKEVEVDETLIHTRKYGCGAIRSEPVWVLGIFVNSLDGFENKGFNLNNCLKSFDRSAV
uniref:ISXO2-like transposase domain-containing protein n=1 Tax=Caenorhabditis japonica TaxID=281687 RepID=A0A8R1E517_CAEJA